MNHQYRVTSMTHGRTGTLRAKRGHGRVLKDTIRDGRSN